MPLLKNGEIMPDSWTVLEGDIPSPLPQESIIVPFTYLSEIDINTISQPLGVMFPCDQDIEALKPYVDRLELIVLHFPTFKDGRAFSQARKIREQLKFTGELRATGHILSDQYQFLIRVGFTTVSLPDTANIQSWQKAMNDFSEAYQPSVLGEKRLSGLRWKV
ncbi:DUF934 domain-containing protein [Commensalibacter nepenthis]|uniref:DUF934 domain-containing protein n=1 Tax=Commensalibacter nepenthis TaxID=3043872 RepID=A0ABT6Q755_9PROT|nr:DUF934 domain-containing protein [Commensalibacter sp. TBRC 10068]MDI2112726.1 DUF934 domain-containing protein [Commensalibacter sp. TBRC 10068]